MVHASRMSLVIIVITRCFKEHVEEITFNKDLLTAPQDFWGFCKTFFLKEERKKKRF